MINQQHKLFSMNFPSHHGEIISGFAIFFMTFHQCDLSIYRLMREHILQNIHVNDNDPSTHTLHIALD